MGEARLVGAAPFAKSATEAWPRRRGGKGAEMPALTGPGAHLPARLTVSLRESWRILRNRVAGEKGAAYRPASLGNGPGRWVSGDGSLQFPPEKRVERLLLLGGGLVRFRVPIESSETNTEASLSALPPGDFLRS